MMVMTRRYNHSENTNIESALAKTKEFLEGLKREYTNNKIFDYSQYFDSMNTVADLIYVNDYTKNEIVFSRGFDTYMGYIKPIKNIVELLNLVHPEDVEDLILLSSTAVETGRALSPKELQGLIFVVDYRVRKENGEYIRILRQSSPIESNNKLGMITNLSLCTDISNIKLNGSVSWRCEGGSQRVFEELLEKNRAYFNKKTKSSELSFREQQILALISKGMKSQQIAEKLFISVHTVNTHRRNMLKKYKVKTLAELMMKVLA